MDWTTLVDLKIYGFERGQFFLAEKLTDNHRRFWGNIPFLWVLKLKNYKKINFFGPGQIWIKSGFCYEPKVVNISHCDVVWCRQTVFGFGPILMFNCRTPAGPHPVNPLLLWYQSMRCGNFCWKSCHSQLAYSPK